MTLILARASMRSALMVTDRLVTVSGAPYDPFANKTIVLADLNGVAAISYTGLAYIGGVPTDKWLVEALIGRKIVEGRHGPGSSPEQSCIAFPPEFLARRLQALQSRLSAVADGLGSDRQVWIDNAFDVVATGFEWDRRRYRPVAVVLSKDRGPGVFSMHRGRRRWYEPVGTQFPAQILAAPSGNASGAALRAIEDRLDSRWGDGSGTGMDVAHHALEMYVAEIEDVASRESVVGPDVMSVLITPPSDPSPSVRVRFVGRGPKLRVETPAGTRVLPASFTPWIVAPGAIRAPSVVAGVEVGIQYGRYDITVDAPPSEGLGVVRSMPRRSPPS